MSDNITQFMIFINQSKRLRLPPHIACEEWFRCEEVLVLFRMKADSQDIIRVCCGKSLCHSGCMTHWTARNSERLNILILFWTFVVVETCVSDIMQPRQQLATLSVPRLRNGMTQVTLANARLQRLFLLCGMNYAAKKPKQCKCRN